jgi:hypothetical protein
MTSQTATLTDFLLARIKEDEAAARAAGVGAWEAGERCVWRESPIATLDIVTDGAAGDGGVETPEIADHIARHDPARVLAECEAKRRIVEYGHRAALETEDRFAIYGLAIADVLRALAQPYADHPDWREEWRA